MKDQETATCIPCYTFSVRTVALGNAEQSSENPSSSARSFWRWEELSALARNLLET